MMQKDKRGRQETVQIDGSLVHLQTIDLRQLMLTLNIEIQVRPVIEVNGLEYETAKTDSWFIHLIASDKGKVLELVNQENIEYIKDNALYASTVSGRGSTMDLAVNDLCNVISGQYLSFLDRDTRNYKLVKIPEKVTYESQ